MAACSTPAASSSPFTESLPLYPLVRRDMDSMHALGCEYSMQSCEVYSGLRQPGGRTIRPGSPVITGRLPIRQAVFNCQRMLPSRMGNRCLRAGNGPAPPYYFIALMCLNGCRGMQTAANQLGCLRNRPLLIRIDKFNDQLRYR